MYIILLMTVMHGCFQEQGPNTAYPTTLRSSSYSYNSPCHSNNITGKSPLSHISQLNGTNCSIIYDTNFSDRRLFVVPAPNNFTVKLSCFYSDDLRSVANRSACLNSTSDANEIASLFSLCRRESPKIWSYGLRRSTPFPWYTTTTYPWYTTTTYNHHRRAIVPYRPFNHGWRFGRRRRYFR
jgi:hypothetical protein